MFTILLLIAVFLGTTPAAAATRCEDLVRLSLSDTTIIYFNNVLKTVGAEAEGSIALFMLPGVLHCGGSPGPDTFDRMAAMSRWVEQGHKPARIVASHLTDGKVDRTRPLCPFGQVARYTGAGDTNDAANFSCQTER
ncbi:MAG: tannase/feruloyl esterase family alpha/beta hydrolase [Acidimicrobiia bacterium]